MNGVGDDPRDDKRIGCHRGEAAVFDVDAPVRPAGQRLAQHLRRSRRSGRAHDDLSAVFLAKPEGLFERVCVGLVHFERGVLLANATPALVDARLPFARGNLLDADGDFHKPCTVYSLPFTVYRLPFTVYRGNAGTDKPR